MCNFLEYRSSFLTILKIQKYLTFQWSTEVLRKKLDDSSSLTILMRLEAMEGCWWDPASIRAGWKRCFSFAEWYMWRFNYGELYMLLLILMDGLSTVMQLRLVPVANVFINIYSALKTRMIRYLLRNYCKINKEKFSSHWSAPLGGYWHYAIVRTFWITCITLF